MLTAAAWAGMAVFGVVMALLGAVLPALSGRLEFGVEEIGGLFLAMNLSMLACSSLIGLAIDRFGMRPPMALGPLLVAGAMALIAGASRFADLVPAVVLLGLGGGALNAATNTLVADLHDDPKQKSAALNLLGVFFGIGALVMPFSIGALLDRFGIGRLLLAAAALCFVTAAFAGSLRYPAPKQQHRLPVAEMPRFLRSPLVVTAACLLFFQSGVEFTMGGYVSTYLTRGFGMGVAAASWVLAAYWAAIIAARIGLSRVLGRADPAAVVIACAVCASAAATLAALAPGAGMAAVAVCLAGFALSGIFPTTLGIAGSAFREYSGTVFGILFSAALTGGALLPWWAGRLAGSAGLRWTFGMVALAFACIAALGAAIRGLTAGRDPRH